MRQLEEKCFHFLTVTILWFCRVSIYKSCCFFFNIVFLPHAPLTEVRTAAKYYPLVFHSANSRASSSQHTSFTTMHEEQTSALLSD